MQNACSFLFIIVTSASNIVEPQLIDVFGSSNNTDPVTKAILLQELFGKIFKISFRKGNIRCNRKLGVAVAGYLNIVT